MHSSGFFQIKLIARLILKCKISGSHMISDQSLLLSTIVLNDICSSYTMGMSGLPDMYTQNLRAAGPRAEGVHIRQTTNAHGITVMCHIAPPLAN